MNVDEALDEHAEWVRDGEWCCTDHAATVLKVLADEVERLREVTATDGARIATDGARIFALQAEVEHLRDIEKRARVLMKMSVNTDMGQVRADVARLILLGAAAGATGTGT